MEILKCDRCKKVIKRSNNPKKLGEQISGTIRSNKIENWISFDLCGNCSKKLIKFIKNYLKKYG